MEDSLHNWVLSLLIVCVDRVSRPLKLHSTRYNLAVVLFIPES